ncbi:acyl-CoA dehydrogenase family protein [Streptomyces sp. L7]
MDFDLPEETLALQDMVREFAANEITPHAAEWSENEVFPTKVFTKLGELGLMGMLVPEEYGGAGSDTVTLCRGDGGTRRRRPVGGLLVERALDDRHAAAARVRHRGTEAALADPAGEGRGRSARSALTEPDAGSGRGRDRATTARRADRDWVINGTKMFITNAGTDISQGVTLLATTGKGADGGRKGYRDLLRPNGHTWLHGRREAEGSWAGTPWTHGSWCSPTAGSPTTI